MYGCTEDGETEEDDDEEESNIARNQKVIDSSSSDSEDNDYEPTKDGFEEEQKMFTRCEEVFQPLMDRLQDAVATVDISKEDDILACLDSMIQNVELLTPPFLREYPIVKLVLSVKGCYEEIDRNVKARCKLLRKEMKRVYSAKEKDVPDGFVPVKGWQVAENLKRVAISEPQTNKSDDVVMETNGCDSSDIKSGHAMKTNEDKGGVEISGWEQQYSIGTAIAKKFGNINYSGKITSYDSTTRYYHIVYSDGDAEDVSESEVAQLLLAHTAWFCIAAPVNGEETADSLRVQAHRELVCNICKKKDNTSKSCLRIPVQCNRGDRCEFEEFKKYHAKSKKQGPSGNSCTEAMHVGCARWGSDYAKVNNKDLRLCYYFSGKPPTYSGEDEYKNPVSNCFCRIHAREIQEGMKRDREGGSESPNSKRARLDVAGDSMINVSSRYELDESTEKERQLHVAISKKKKDADT